MVNERRQPWGSSLRTKTDKLSSCVRFNDHKGLEHKFNKTGFRSVVQRGLYYDFVKRYEKELRGEADASSGRKERLNYQKFSESNRLKPLPEGFGNFANKEKVDALNKLCEEQANEAAPKIVGQDEDVDIQVNHPDKMEVDEGSAADLGPEVLISTSPLPDGDSLDYVARNQQDNPQGRPPPSPAQHPDESHQCVRELKLRASRYPDILQHVVSLIKKLEDRELSEALGVDSRTTRSRSRQEEILSQLLEDITPEDPQNQLSKPLMEGIGSQTSYSQASNFSQDVERGVKNNVTTMPHVKQIPALDPLSAALSLGVLPDQDISEALEVTPSYTGRLKANREEIHPQVFVHNTAWDLQYQFSKPMMEGVGPEVSYPQASDLWGDEQCGGEYLTTMPDCGGNSTSQIVPMGHSISAELSALERTTGKFSAEELWNEPALEGSLSPLWTHYWSSPVRRDFRGAVHYAGLGIYIKPMSSIAQGIKSDISAALVYSWQATNVQPQAGTRWNRR